MCREVKKIDFNVHNLWSNQFAVVWVECKCGGRYMFRYSKAEEAWSGCWVHNRKRGSWDFLNYSIPPEKVLEAFKLRHYAKLQKIPLKHAQEMVNLSPTCHDLFMAGPGANFALHDALVESGREDLAQRVIKPKPNPEDVEKKRRAQEHLAAMAYREECRGRVAHREGLLARAQRALRKAERRLARLERLASPVNASDAENGV